MINKKDFADERREVIRSINFSKNALEKSAEQIVKVLDLIRKDDLPKECYKNYIKGLAIVACFSKNHALPKLITEQLSTLIIETNSLEKEVPHRIGNKDFSTHVEKNQDILKHITKPYLQYYDENLNKHDAAIEEFKDGNYALRELGLFRDIPSSNLPPLPFRPFLIAEAMAFVAIYNQGAIGKNAFGFLSETYSKEYKTDEISYESDSLKFSAARGLSQIIIHNNDKNRLFSKKAFNLLLSELFSNDQNDRLITKEAIMRIAIEKPEEFFKNNVIDNIAKYIRESSHNLNEAAKVIEVLAHNDPDKIKSANVLLQAIELSKNQGNEGWKYFDYYIKGDTEKLPLAEEASKLLKDKDANCLIVHNIRESLGDEWIRQKNLLQGLLDHNPNLKITMATNKPFLYNNPRITALDISKDDSLTKLQESKFNMVYNQYYEDGSYSEKIQDIILDKHRNRSPLYIETGCTSNFHDASASYISLEMDGKRKFEIFSNKSLENLYAMTLKISANLGLPVHNLEKGDILCGSKYEPAEAWWSEKITNNHNKKNRSVMVYNFGGGTYEDKGHTKFEIDVVAKEIVNEIKKGHLVIILSSTSEWNNHKKIDEVLELIPEDKRRFCVTDVPTPMQDSFMQFHILHKSDAIKTVEGGIAHLATSLGKPTEILVKNGTESGTWRLSSGKSVIPPLLESDLIKNQIRSVR